MYDVVLGQSAAVAQTLILIEGSSNAYYKKALSVPLVFFSSPGASPAYYH